MKKILLLFLMFTCFISCEEKAKTHLIDLDFKKDSRNEYAFNKNGTVFTGTAWSSDEKTIKIVAKNGVIMSTTIYHHNGQVAAYISEHENRRTLYDHEGKITDEKEFEFWYPNLVAQIKAIENEIHRIDK